MSEIKDNLFSKDYGERFICLLTLVLLNDLKIPHQYERHISNGYMPPEVRFSTTKSIGFFDLIQNAGEEALRAIYSPDYRDMALSRYYMLDQDNPFLIKMEDAKTFFLYFMECLERIYSVSNGRAVMNPIDENDNEKPYSWNTFKHVIVPYYPGDIKAAVVHCDKKQVGAEPGTYSVRIKTIEDGISISAEPKALRDLRKLGLTRRKEMYKKLGFPYQETYAEYVRFLKLNFKAMDVRVNGQSFTVKAESIFDLFIPFE